MAATRTRSAALVAIIIAACSSAPDPVKTSPPAPPSKDPAHCVFEPAPLREARPAAAASEVRAGFGTAILPMPIGAPLGGYGDRLITLGQAQPADARPRRFTKSFVPSVGVHDAPRADVLAIEAGGERFVLVRIDAPLVTENTLFELESAAAPDGSLRGRILLSASHSHAAWAGWQASLVLMPGIDRPRRDLADRMVSGMAAAVKKAIADLGPARIGVAVDNAFDPMDRISHDRRHQNDDVKGPDGNTAGKGKDPVMWAMRLDRPDGKPLAAIVDMGIHGTVGDSPNSIVSTDAPGAIARALSAELGYPVLHLQGAAGDVSPEYVVSRKACPGDTRCLDMPGLEVVGARAAGLMMPLVLGIKTGDKASLEVVTRTFYEGRDAAPLRLDGTELRYTSADVEPDGIFFDASGKVAVPVDELTTEAGAGLCGDAEAGSFGPLSGASGPYSSCVDIARGAGIIFGLFEVPSNVPLPLCDTVRTTATAVRISGTPSGDWLIASIPGEPTAPFVSYLRSRSPAGPERTLIVGYANDHAGYILTAEDWLSGGYEPSTNVWGPLEGEIILDGILEAAKIAWTPELEDPEAGTSRFVDWVFPETTQVNPIVTADHGKIAPGAKVWWPDTTDASPTAAGAQVSRAVGAARFTWYGGDPAVDMPEVIIEREASKGVWEPLSTLGGRPASSNDGAVVITYTPDPLDSQAPERHIYAAVWQPVPPDPLSEARPDAPFSLPPGQYRFHAVGAAVSASGPVAYDVVSDAFEVKIAPLDASSTALKGTSSIDIQALLPAAPGLRALLDGPSDVPLPLPSPWTVTVSFADTTMKQVTAQPDASGKASIAMNASEIASAISVDVRDKAGNGGSLALP